MLPLLPWIDDALARPVAPQARALDEVPEHHLLPLLAELLAQDELTPGDWAALAARTWMRCGDAPLIEAPATFWRELFTRGGWAVNGHRDVTKVLYVTLWRGAAPQWQRGWAWADQRRVAELHASANGERSPVGRLWKTRAPRAALLASILHLRGGAHEIVCDPDLLGEVEPVGDVDADEETWATLRPRQRRPSILDDPMPLPRGSQGIGARLLGGR